MGGGELKPFRSTQIVTEGNIHTASTWMRGWLESIKSRAWVLPTGSGERPLLPQSTLVWCLFFKSVNYCQRQQRFLSGDTLGGAVFCPLLQPQPESQPMRTHETANKNHCSPWAPEMKCPDGSSFHGDPERKTCFGWDVMKCKAFQLWEWNLGKGSDSPLTMLMSNTNAACEDWEAAPRTVCTFCCGLWGRTCSQHKSNQHGSEGVSRASGLYQTWLSFPLEVTRAVTGRNVTCRNITMQKSHGFVRDKVTYNSAKQVFVQLQPWFYGYSKHGCWALEKDSLFLLMLYNKTFIWTRTQILFCASGSICLGRCIWSEQRGTCSVRAHQLDLQLKAATKLESATTRVTFLALSC